VLAAGAPSQTPLPEAYSAPPNPLAGLEAPTSKGQKRGEERGREKNYVGEAAFISEVE